MKVNHALEMAKDYVNQVYPSKVNLSPNQREESEQHFLMGIWAMLQLAKKMPAEKIEELEKEIREYQEKRVKELEELQKKIPGMK